MKNFPYYLSTKNFIYQHNHNSININLYYQFRDWIVHPHMDILKKKKGKKVFKKKLSTSCQKLTRDFQQYLPLETYICKPFNVHKNKNETLESVDHES